METQENRLEEAREHYNTRADRRPKQHWDDAQKCWVKEVM